MQFHRSLKAVIKVANVKFPGGSNAFFMTFSALLCARSFPVRHWNTATVDQIVIEGDRMYLNALESQSVPDTDTFSLIYLPNQACSTVQSPAIEVTQQNQSPVEVTKSPSEANNSRQSPVEAKTILNKSLAFLIFHMEALLLLNMQLNVQE